MNAPQHRRKFLRRVGFAAALAPLSLKLNAKSDKAVPSPEVTRPQPKRLGALPKDLVREIVSVSHSKINRVEELLDQEPNLVYASWDWGGGDWEMPLGSASHVGRRDIAQILLSYGARKDLFAAAMLGERGVVKAMVNADPKMAEQKGPHGFRVLYHAAISGDVEMASIILANIKNGNAKPQLDQSLHAAERDGHYDMTRWILERGATSVNKRGSMGETPLKVATRHGDSKLVELLRGHGAIDTVQ